MKWAYKIDRKLYTIFIALIAITILNAFISTYIIGKSKNITIEIAEVSNPSQSALFDFSELINKSWLLATHAVYQQDNKEAIDNLNYLNKYQYPAVKKSLLSLSKSWKSQAELDSLTKIFSCYDQLIYFESQLLNKLHATAGNNILQKNQASEEILVAEINPLVEDLSVKLVKLTLQKREEATRMQKQMIQSFILLMAVVLGLALIIINFIIVITYFLNKNIVGPIMKIRRFILQLSKGELPQLNMQAPSNVVGEMMGALKSHVEGLKRTAHFANDIGQGNFYSHFEPLSENDVQGKALLEMRDKLKAVNDDDAARNWISEGMERISVLNHNHSLDMNLFCNNITKEVVNYSDAKVGFIFLTTENPQVNEMFDMKGFYSKNGEVNFLLVEWIKKNPALLVIQKNQPLFISGNELPLYLQGDFISPGGGCILFMPLVAGGKVLGVMGLASEQAFSATQLNYFNRLIELVSASIFGVKSNIMTRELLEESLLQADELASQKQELAWVNETLLTKSNELEQSQVELKKQQEELKIVNADLEIKAHLLEERNLAIEEARQSLAFKAAQLEQSSKFKSAFLANMSHELRTPLNSILILAKLLSENKNNNLTPKQAEHAGVIHKSGSDLLMLINDILDLSKIESGKLEFVFEKTNVHEIANDMKLLFTEFAVEKQIGFKVVVMPDAFDEITSDKLRLEQIIKNLISNALKFTPKNGEVTLQLSKADEKLAVKHGLKFTNENMMAICVTDTGIGIPEQKQKIIFEAFNQADNSTSRKYGGTGLGLTISREIAHMLGGEILLESEPGKGSSFTLLVPEHTSENSQGNIEVQHIESKPEPLPEVKTFVESPLKNTPVTLFGSEEFADDRNFITPYDHVILIVEKDVNFLKVLIDYCHIYNLKAIATQSAETALSLAKQYLPKAILTEMKLPDMDGLTFLSHLKSDAILKHLPVHFISSLKKETADFDGQIVSYHKKPLNKNELEMLMKMMLPAIDNNMISAAGFLSQDQSLQGKTILMADDDMRNIYALTTLIENAGANLICAYDGKEALEKLEKNPHVDIVLMDIMMPVMNGYAAISEIRKNEKFKTLPIIAITANHLEEERQKCMESGASAYLSKPLNNDLLLHKIQFCLYQ